MIPDPKILLGHGSGGRLTHDLIRDVLLKRLNNPILGELLDSARINYKEKLAFTTDSFVVSPLFFPGGDIGKLAVCGTVNDLLMVGAIPEYLALSLIIEEGLGRNLLERIIDSVALHAKSAKVTVVTGDTKVVEKGALDKIFINTAGLGRIINGNIALGNIKSGDKIILTGTIGEHGLAVLAKRKGLDLKLDIKSDCASLRDLLLPLIRMKQGIKFMRDPTRGGVATALNEIIGGTGLGIVIDEKEVPVAKKTRAAAELLGIDPLYVANEGRALLVVEASFAQRALCLLRKKRAGANARIIGEVRGGSLRRLVMRTSINTERILDMLTSEPLPRIC